MRVNFNLLLTREQFERRSKLLGDVDEVAVVENLANWVLLNFFKLDPEEVERLDGERVSAAGLLNEPINWAALSAIVERTEPRGLKVTLEETSSWKLCRYVQEWLTRWGWEDVEIEACW